MTRTCVFGVNNLFNIVSALEKHAMIAQGSQRISGRQRIRYIRTFVVPTGERSKNPGSKMQIVDMVGWPIY